MENYYANERNVLILVALLKAHGISKIIASPGTTNLSFVASLQCDPFFEMYSCVDERSAAYMACGLAAETDEPVVLTCTGATASRNYLSGLTEAYYRKLPILAVTGTQSENRIGQLHSQVIDRSVIQNDVARLSVHLQLVRNDEEAHDCEVLANKAITELTRHGGGPVHINLRTSYTRDFSVKELPKVQLIERKGYDTLNSMPEMPDGRIGIFLGSHNTFTKELTEAIDLFCQSRNAVVFCDHTSGYYGRYKVNFSLVASQKYFNSDLCDLDLCIHIGEVSAEYGCLAKFSRKQEVWRVSEDGEIRDLFYRMRYVFEMTEQDFFSYYTLDVKSDDSYLNECKHQYTSICSKMPELPFSNIWMASVIIPKLPIPSVLHLGILNSTRSWNLFCLPEGIRSFSNVGGFGIDGGVSSLIGASFADANTIYFGVVGDLAFFYDMNALGNRHIGKNIRLMVVNNGRGTEFRNFYHPGFLFGDDADKYIAAGGHFGSQSPSLVRDYATNLGFEYLSASNKDDFHKACARFVSPEMTERPILFETFTDCHDESDALKMMWEIEKTAEGLISERKKALTSTMRKVLGRKGIGIVKAILRKK